jgi:hypothetical protein
MHFFHLPRLLIWALTFPGVMVRIRLKAWLCRRTGLTVTKVVPFQYEEDRPGYIEHDGYRNLPQQMLAQTGSGIACGLLCCALSAVGPILDARLGGGSFLLNAPLNWLSISIGTYIWLLPDEDFPRQAIKDDQSMGSFDKAICRTFGEIQFIGSVLNGGFIFDVVCALCLCGFTRELVRTAGWHL